MPTNDIVIPPTPAPSSTSGCEPGDFTPAPANEPAVALIQRGTCTFEDKANNAIAAGYDAVIIFNEGQPGPGRTCSIGTLGNPVDIPVVGLSFADGAALYAQTQAGPVVGPRRHRRPRSTRPARPATSSPTPRAATRTRSWSSAPTSTR